MNPTGSKAEEGVNRKSYASVTRNTPSNQNAVGAGRGGHQRTTSSSFNAPQLQISPSGSGMTSSSSASSPRSAPVGPAASSPWSNHGTGFPTLQNPSSWQPPVGLSYSSPPTSTWSRNPAALQHYLTGPQPVGGQASISAMPTGPRPAPPHGGAAAPVLVTQASANGPGTSTSSAGPSAGPSAGSSSWGSPSQHGYQHYYYHPGSSYSFQAPGAAAPQYLHYALYPSPLVQNNYGNNYYGPVIYSGGPSTSAAQAPIGTPPASRPTPGTSSSTYPGHQFLGGYSSYPTSASHGQTGNASSSPQKLAMATPKSASPPVTNPSQVAPGPFSPPNLQEHYDETSISLSTYKTFPVDPTSPEYQTITGMLDPVKVISADLVVHPLLWKRYCDSWKEMLRTKSDDLSLLSKLKLDEREYLRCAHLSLNFDKDPLLTTEAGAFSPNEVLLFHCTRNQDSLNKILLQGLDERLSSPSGSLLGKGIYFSDDPQKAMKYDGGTGVVLIFAVLLGDCLAVDHIADRHTFVREPEKEKVQRRNFNDLFFDSITARPAQHNEFVIYNRFQCCPLYMVKYQGGGATPGNQGTSYSTARQGSPTVAWRSSPGKLFPMPNQTLDRKWPFFASSIFEKMGILPIPDEDPSQAAVGSENLKEDCLICYSELDSFRRKPSLWKELQCGHKVCVHCYKSIEISGTTMTGAFHTSVKCPFCLDVAGTEVGDCPDGKMTVTFSPESCEGYEGYGTIQITYFVSTIQHYLRRTAFLPDNAEGKEVLILLATAWDRRLCFTIGTSATTGSQNALVWNIHHKTAIQGGIQSHGYPDPGYLERVKWELKLYGIE